MDARFEIAFRGRYIEVRSDGHKSLEYSRQLFLAIRDACNHHQCYRVLGIGNSSEPLPISDAYDHADLFNEVGTDSRFRLAWAELNPAAKEPIRFIEDVLFNRSLPGKAGDSVDDALVWLSTDGHKERPKPPSSSAMTSCLRGYWPGSLSNAGPNRLAVRLARG